MKYRFFTKTRPNGEHIKLFLLATDEKKKEIHELMLDKDEWKETSSFIKIMIDGLQDVKEINQEKALELYDGLKNAMDKKFKSKDENE